MLEDERQEVCRWLRNASRDGLVVGRSGNVSARRGELVAISPTGVDAETIEPADVPVVDLAGVPVTGRLAPSSELPLHLAVYAAAPARAAVVHTHAPHATAVSVLVDEVPAVHYVLGMLGGSVRVAPYATYGSPELARAAATALDGRDGCLLQNHGTVTTGTDLAQAYERSLQLEWVCRVWLLAAAAGTPQTLTPKTLPHEELARVTEQLQTYGQPTTLARPVHEEHP